VTDKELKALGKKLKVDFKKIPLAQFKKGFAVELEHGKVSPKTNVTNNDPVKTAKIALAHLKESSTYYNKLSKMEKTFTKKKVAKKGKR